LTMKSNFQNRRINWVRRLIIIIGIALLHVLSYYLANLINSQRPSVLFCDFWTIIDSWIPYLGWTWVFYYFGDIYITLWAAVIVWKLPDMKFRRVIYAYCGMIITGALLQIIFPGKAPWPKDLIGPQQFMHNLISMRPYACVPSMHVALTVLPACILLSESKSLWIKVFSTLIAILITVSTLTLKEHFFLDAVTGLLLGLVFFGVWQFSPWKRREIK